MDRLAYNVWKRSEGKRKFLVIDSMPVRFANAGIRYKKRLLIIFPAIEHIPQLRKIYIISKFIPLIYFHE